MANIKPVFNLTPEEQAMEDSFVKGGYTSRLLTDEEKKHYAQIARNTIAKNKAITIRLSQRDLIRVKTKAAQEGIPYQTYIASLIHKYS